MEKIELLMSTDEGYAQHLGVTLLSVLHNTKHAHLFSITILDGGISDENKKRLQDIASRHQASLRFEKIVLDKPEKYIVNGHISIAAYYRILLQKVYSPEVKRIIYLDCDLIVNQDLKLMYGLDLKGKMIGAVTETSNSRMKDIGREDLPYFNSGVMIIDFQKWIKNNMTEKTLDFIYHNPEKLVYWDQDALNFCSVGDWMPLDIKWNYLRDYVILNKNYKNSKSFIPHIVHYSNNVKPWHFHSRNPYDYLYYKYLKLSPWKDFKPKPKSSLQRISKYVYALLIKFNLNDGFSSLGASFRKKKKLQVQKVSIPIS